MPEQERLRNSLRRRITAMTMVVFLTSIWGLSLIGARMLRVEMERVLAVQQASTVSYVAGDLNEDLNFRRSALERIAKSIDASVLGQPQALQQRLAEHPDLQEMFNAGVTAVPLDAPVPAASRTASWDKADPSGAGVLRTANDASALRRSIFRISAPIRDGSQNVIGTLFGAIDLARPNFLDRLSNYHYGKGGTLLVLDLERDLFVAATDKERIAMPLPAVGSNLTLDKRRNGFMGSEIAVNSRGIEVLTSAALVPASGWLVVATLPSDEAFAPIRSTQQRIIAAALALTLIAGAIFWWQLRRQFAPLRAALDALGRMFDAQTPPKPLPIARRDEIGQLVGGFNRLLGKLTEHEAQLEAERNFFSAVLQQAADGVLLFERDDMRIREVNPRLCRMLGYERAALLEKRFGELLADTADCSEEQLAQLTQGMQPLVGECKFRRQDGTDITVEVRASLVETAGRQLIMVNLRDLSERILLEHRLAQSQQHMELALLGADLGLWDWHLPSGAVTFNERWTQMLGYKLDEIAPHIDSWKKLVHPDDWSEINAALEPHLRGETAAYRSKHRLRHKEGHWVWVVARGRVVERDAAGVPLRAAGTHLDISSQRQVEQAHREAHLRGVRLLRRIESLMRHAGDCIMMLDSGTRILEVSDACLETYGYTREEFLAMRAIDLRTPQAREEVGDYMQRLEQRGSMLYQTWHCRKDGRDFPVEIGAAMIDDGNERFIQVIIRDISERVRERSSMEDELAAYAKRLELASRRVLVVQEESRRRFSGELHDRTSPNLAAIRINLAIIARLESSQSQERAERLEDTRALIDDTEASLREICAEMRPPVLDYAGLAAALEGHAQQFSARTGIMVQVDCAKGKRRLAPAMESLLFRIYQEALTNSLKHANAKSISVTLTSSGTPITLAVADDGVGFDLKMLENDEHTYGLGLLNMREMVEFSGGRFGIESHPGQGTRIEVTI